MSGASDGYVPVATALSLFHAEKIPFQYVGGGVFVGTVLIPTRLSLRDAQACYCVRESRVLAVLLAVRYARTCGMEFAE
jgi:hypothetical protein